MKIYLAGSLFSEAERDWMKKLKNQIERFAAESGRTVHVIWPYELITQPELEQLGGKAKHEIFLRCKAELDKSDILIALLDGPQVDDGTAREIGYYYALRRGRIIGIRTDFRNAGESEGATVNAMIECTCDRIVHSVDGVFRFL